MNEELKNSTDEDIALAVQSGNKEAFGILMSRYEKKLSRYGSRFISRSDNIEDCVQDVFINSYRNINNFDASFKFSSWIYRIAHNTFINELKKYKKTLFFDFDFDVLISHPIYEEPEENEKDQEFYKQLVEKGLDSLKEKYKEVIILYYIEDLSYKEISDILKIPKGTVGVRIRRGKEMLKKVYNEEEIKEIIKNE
jgi:RNA polymerase sigma-70 factor (ECF subfamily)